MYSDEESGYIVEDGLEEEFVPSEEEVFDDNYEESYSKPKSNKKLIIITLILAILLVILLLASCNKGDKIPSIRILDEKVEINVLDTYDLDIDLVNNDNINIEWGILDGNIALIDNDGVVTGERIGHTKAWVRYVHSDNKEYKDDAVVIVYQGEKGVELIDFSLDKEIRIKVGNQARVNFNVEPYNSYIDSINYFSNDEGIAIVDVDGNITGIKKGTTKIDVTLNDNITRTVDIVVYDEESSDGGSTSPSKPVTNTKPTSVKFKESNISITVNQTKKLNYIVSPSSAKDYSVKFENSNDTVLQIDKNGNIKGISMGTSVVTIKINDNITSQVTVTVKPYVVYVNDLNITSNVNLVLNKGDSSQIEYEVSPANASNKTVEFTSSNELIATVDNNGLIKARNRGNCIITVKTMDGNKTVNIVVVVN